VKLVNFEFKARLKDEKRVRAALRRLRARFVGTDRQVDTYFCVPGGRLKVREGRIENALIFYRRSDAPRARRSVVEITLLPRRNSLGSTLAAALGVLGVVDKRREIYFVGNVKIHLDRVRGLGKYVEVEAIRKSTVNRRQSRVTDRRIRAQAKTFQELLGIANSDILPQSYSDLILNKSSR
jgi:predicted adenylyl cyclase CyaB